MGGVSGFFVGKCYDLDSFFFGSYKMVVCEIIDVL